MWSGCVLPCARKALSGQGEKMVLLVFRLEELTVANGISHADAHDAVSDVRATIAMARLLREKQEKLV